MVVTAGAGVTITGAAVVAVDAVIARESGSVVNDRCRRGGGTGNKAGDAGADVGSPALLRLYLLAGFIDQTTVPTTCYNVDSDWDGGL